MSVKLADDFQIREHSWPCLFHITSLLSHWSLPPILVDMISRDVTSHKDKNALLTIYVGFHILQEV